MSIYDSMITVHSTPYSPLSIERRIKYAYKRKTLRIYLNHDPEPPYIARVRYGKVRWISSCVGGERFIMKRFPTLARKIRDYENLKARVPIADIFPPDYHGPFSG